MKESTFLFIKMQPRLVETPAMLSYEQQDSLRIPCMPKMVAVYSAEKWQNWRSYKMYAGVLRVLNQNTSKKVEFSFSYVLDGTVSVRLR